MGGADNVQLDKNTTTGAIIAADAVVVGTTTQYHQRVKISIGTSGSASDVHSGNRLPVITTTGSLIAVRATGTSLAVKVSGSITIVEPITISGAVKVSGVVTVSPTGNFYVVTPTGTSLPVRVSGNVNLAEPITISGVVRATGTRADRGAFTKGTSLIFPIGGYFGTGGVTASGQLSAIRTSSQGITFIRATGTALPVKVSGSVTIVEPITVSGTIKVSGGPISVKATGTALAVKVSGNVNLAEPITISGTVGLRADFVDEATFTAGSDRVIAIGARFGTDVVGASGDIGIIRMTSGRVLLVTGISPAGATAVNIGAEFVDEATFTLETSRVVAIGARFGADSVGAAGDIGVIRMTSGRVLLVTGISGSGVTHGDDAAFTPAVDDIVPFGAYFTSVTGTPDQVNIGDAGVVRMTSGRILLVGLSTTSGGMKQNIVRVSGNVNLAEPITVSGTVRVAPTGTALAVKVSGTVSIAEPITISGSVSVSGMRADRAAFTKGTSEIIPIGAYFGTGGLTASGQVGVIRTSSQGIIFVRATGTALPVKVSGSVTLVEPITISGAVKVSGTVTVKVSGNVSIAEPITISGTITDITNTIVSTISGNVNVQGVVAADALATGARPVLIAGRARTTEPSVVGTGDSSYIWTDLFGRQVTILNHPAQPRSTGTTGHGPRYFVLTATTVSTMIAAPGAGQSIHITTLYPSNVGVANTLSVFESGDTATGGKGFRARFASAGGGAIIKYDPPWKLTANRLLAGRLDSSSAGMIINVHYYVAP